MTRPSPTRAGWFSIPTAILVALPAGCRQAPPDTREADLAALRQADAAFATEATAKNVDGVMAYYADDAALLLSNAPTAQGRDAIRKIFADMLATPGFRLTWQATGADVAASGDLGYTVGSYEETVAGPTGIQTTDKGKYVVVWKKQADGAWKAVIDVPTSDLPAAR